MKICFLFLTLPFASQRLAWAFPAYSEVPWRTDDTSKTILNSDLEEYRQMGVSFFAPSGRLVLLEDAMSQIQSDASSNTVVALACRDGVIVLTTLPTSPYLGSLVSPNTTLQDPDVDSEKRTIETMTEGSKTPEVLTSMLSPSPFFYEILNGMDIPATARPPFVLVDPPTSAPVSGGPILAITVGNSIASQLIRRNLIWSKILANTIASESDWDVAQLARRCADVLQVTTQDASSDGDGILPVSLIWLDAHQIWKVDPTGQFWKLQAAVAGRYATRVEALLVERLSAGTTEISINNSKPRRRSSVQLQQYVANLSTNEALDLARECVNEAYKVELESNHQYQEHKLSILRLRAVVFSKNTKSVRSFDSRYGVTILADS